ncbi:hypothetical protein [Arachidicoccus terrestris]|uniref:hypothetical protein n=1 Tax=Arachidicoccus terrestris TaxID=2875539 RepID=UPI001CC6AED8|nr:hypothetical protein [Arachidicoccus terrestris]UAY55934.1 hypothetical protein K9M52_02555 [Arachidicoccus terrestris]
MKKLLPVLILFAACSSSKRTTEIPKSFQGVWSLGLYSRYDSTGAATNSSAWLIDKLSVQHYSVTAIKYDSQYEGNMYVTGDSVTIDIKRHPEMRITGNTEFLDEGTELRIGHNVNGKLIESWVFTKPHY